MIEASYEYGLKDKDVHSKNGHIFALKNFGWKDHKDLDVTSNGKKINIF